MRPRILITESRGFSPRAAERLREFGDVALADFDRPALRREIATADVLWVRLRHHIDAPLLADAPRVRMIVTPTTGLNHIDLEAAERCGVVVLSLRGETEFLRSVRATAEHTLALILALLRRLPAAAAHVRDGGWDRDAFRGQELSGKTVGIVGYGRLGQRVAQYLAAFDVTLIATDPAVLRNPSTVPVRMVALDELLEQADLVTLHASFSEASRSFFGRRQFARMKGGAWFVNTARGELVDERALLDALRSGHLAGAALDVLSDETSAVPASHPLVAYARQHERLIITPHLGGCTAESMERTELFLADKLCHRWRSAADRPAPPQLAARS